MFGDYFSKDFVTLVVDANRPELVWGGGIRLLGTENDMSVVDKSENSPTERDWMKSAMSSTMRGQDFL